MRPAQPRPAHTFPHGPPCPFRPPLPPGVLYELCNSDALAVTEGDVFDGVYSLVK